MRILAIAVAAFIAVTASSAAQAAEGQAFCVAKSLRPIVFDRNDDDIRYLTERKMPPRSRNSVPGAVQLTSPSNIAVFSQMFPAAEDDERRLEARYKILALEVYPDGDFTTDCVWQPSKERAGISYDNQKQKLRKIYGNDKLFVHDLVYTDPPVFSGPWMVPSLKDWDAAKARGSLPRFEYRISQAKTENGKVLVSNALQWQCRTNKGEVFACDLPQSLYKKLAVQCTPIPGEQGYSPIIVTSFQKTNSNMLPSKEYNNAVKFPKCLTITGVVPAE
ncbi:MAG: hypothetical protein QM667_06240 [Asticcacaulis sp.]